VPVGLKQDLGAGWAHFWGEAAQLGHLDRPDRGGGLGLPRL